MTPDEARAELEAAFIAAFVPAHPEADYFIDGVSEPDFETQSKPFAFLSVGLPRHEQSGFNGDAPPKRYYGEIEIGLFVRDGQGTRPFFLMSRTVENSLTVRTITAITLRGMTPMKRTSALGWQGRLLVIPYQFDS